MKKFRVGIAGMGFMGFAHNDNLRRQPNVEVVAFSKPTNPEEAAKRVKIDRFYADTFEMIDKENLDVIHICTTNSTHYPIAKYAFEHGVHVVCEKPLSLSVAEAEELLALAEAKGLLHAVNFHNRFHPMTFELREMIAGGDLGRIISVHGGYIQGWLINPAAYGWRADPAQGGKTRVIADIGSHWFDLVEYVTGQKVVKLAADFSTVYDTRTSKNPAGEVVEHPITTEDLAALSFRLEGGAVGSAMISQSFAGAANKISLFVGGTDNSAIWDSEDLNRMVLGNPGGWNQIMQKDPSRLHPATASVIDYPGGHVEGFPDNFRECFKSVYTQLSGGAGPFHHATFADGLRSMYLIDRIFEAATSHQWVEA